MFGFAAAFVALFLLDQVSKTLLFAFGKDIAIIPGFLSFSLRKNSGAAFSFLEGKDWAQTFFLVLTAAALVAFLVFLLRTDPEKRTLRVAFLLILAGAFGNFVDRAAFAYVRDFIYFDVFPYTFNVADACLVIGAALFLVHYLFLDPDALFRPRKKGKDECANAQTSETGSENGQKTDECANAQAAKTGDGTQADGDMYANAQTSETDGENGRKTDECATGQASAADGDGGAPRGGEE